MRIKGNGYYSRGNVAQVVKKRNWFLFDNHKTTVTRKLRYWKNIRRHKSAFSRIRERIAFMSFELSCKY